MLKYIMEVSEKSKEGRNIFTAWISKRTADKRKITAENQAVAVKYVYSFIVKVIFTHTDILE